MDADRPDRARRWTRRLGLAVLPIVLALVGYYRPVLRGGPLPRMAGDGAFYVYQLSRACELGGRWWKVGEDDRIGKPYPPVTAKHPGIYEGVDLMLVSAVTGRFLGPTANYHAMTVLALAVNGWVASWLAFRMTRSHGWAALAVLLITLNAPTAGRVGGHLHLFKFGWVLLAVWAFARYLEAPTTRRGLLLGLATAWVLQGSFYLGFLLGVGLAAWWVGCLAAGKLGRGHLGATLAAGLGVAVAGAALTFPVWTSSRRAPLAGQYFQRWRTETWLYGAELWQYFVPPSSASAADYIAGFREKRLGAFWEGWNYPGRLVLLAIAAYAVARMRGRRLGSAEARFLDLAMGLIAVFVVLSLAGGPSFLIYRWFPGFRCYGRAGLVALALGCVAAPAVLQGVTRSIRNRGLRLAVVSGIVILAAIDAAGGVAPFRFTDPGPDPAWSSWLAGQPGNVRLAAFAPGEGEPFMWWGIVGLDQGIKHRHATLNGGEFALLEGDLKLLGASYDRMTPDGLRLVVSLGYDALAFHRDYLAAHPWIAALPWLGRQVESDGWSIYRVAPDAPRFAAVPLERLLAESRGPAAPQPIPPGAWITGRFGLGRDGVVAESSRVRAVWEDADGKRIGKPVPALFQHVFGPDLPAYTIRSPEAAGPHRLVFYDDSGRRLASVPYRIDPGLKVAPAEMGGGAADAVVGRIEPGGEPAKVVLENLGGGYFQAHSYRDPSYGVAASQPGMYPPTLGSLVLRVRPIPQAGQPAGAWTDWLLPTDLPPGGRIEMDLPSGRLGVGGPMRVEFEPRRVGPGSRAAASNIRLQVSTAGDPGATRR